MSKREEYRIVTLDTVLSKLETAVQDLEHVAGEPHEYALNAISEMENAKFYVRMLRKDLLERSSQ